MQSGVVFRVKRGLRSLFGLWPVLEMRNRFALGFGSRRIKRYENSEVERLKKLLCDVPTARIACIIPTYQRADHLIKAINSILAQSVQDFVVLVVDDGGGLPSEMPADSRIVSISLSKNTKVPGMVRNVGIRLSESIYVAFLDDDNTWSPDHLSVTLKELERGADIVYSAVRRSREDGSELDVLTGAFDRKRFANETSWIDTSAIVIRRTKLRYFSRLPRATNTFPREDWEFVWRNSRKSKILHVPIVTVNYLVNEKSHFTMWKPEQTGGGI